MNKTDLQLMQQLWNGHHLEPKEIKRAGQVLLLLNNELNNRN